MDYTLHQLKIFLKVAQTQSITKAAEELHLTQPAISIQLKKLQEQFEVPLIEIIGRKLYVTDFGKEITEASKRILNEVHEIKYKTLAYKGKLVGNLKISVVSTGKYVMPYFLTEFIRMHEGVDLSIDVTNRTSVINSLENNEVDFALVSILPENIMVEREELMENNLVMIGNKPLASKKGNLDKRTLEKIPLIYREKGSATRLVMERFINQRGISPQKKLELTSNEAVKQAVLAGLGYSVMSMSGLKNELQDKGLFVIPIKGLPIVTNWNLVWLKEKKFSPAAAAYLSFLRNNKERIINEQFRWHEKLKI